MEYVITIAQLAYGNITVEADDREEAKKLALKLTKKDCDRVNWFESKSYQVAEVYRIDKQ